MLRFVSPSGLVAVLLLGQAPAAAPPRSQSAEINRLIAQLASGSFREREEASKGLEAIGEPALPALARAAGSTDLEVRRRALWLLKRSQVLLREVVTSLQGKWDIDPEAPDEEALRVKLTGKHISDGELARVKWLAGVGRLYLRHTRVSDAGLAHVAEYQALRRLSLFGTPIADRGLRHICRLESLECLDLEDTQVSDAGLAYLKGLRELRRLYLGGTTVSDGGLVHLHGLPHLQRISLARTRVTSRGIAELQRALPGVVIER
jgi:hypothetical protein